MTTQSPGSSRLPAPVERIDGWAVLGGVAGRLWERGCFGRPIHDGILLTAAEVLNAHRLRGLPLPHPEWMAESLAMHPNLLFECEVLDALRYPGEKVVLETNLSAANAVLLDERSWGLRWSREHKVRESEPTAEIRWFRARDAIDWDELSDWTTNVAAGGRVAEILIVDDEHGVVTYRCAHHDPRGSHPDPFREMANDDRRLLAHAWADARKTAGGHWLDLASVDWPVHGIGIGLEEGTWVDELESRVTSRIVNPTMPRPDGAFGLRLGLMEDLLIRGLSLRSGFKYGTRWRAYAGAVGSDHAPWLVVPLAEAPTDWGEACLSARLAAGVNKHWLCALSPIAAGGWRYLALERPPSDSRWTNPVRH